MNLNRDLIAPEIEFLPKGIYETSGGYICQLVPYKDARVDMDILDDEVGFNCWQNEYRRDSNGVLQCGIGVFFEDIKRGEWVWKWSNGTPSEYEKVKGEYSDAFKRAGFMWGIGRCLYNFPRIGVYMVEGEYEFLNDKIKATRKFKPNDWKWEFAEAYQKIVAKQKFGNRWKERYNSEPYKKIETK